tara:strand:+ start:11487 stop:11897 length:411 start_codon:yes stop_codon:yes gene_type:complete
MKWFNVLKLDRAKLRLKEKEIKERMDERNVLPEEDKAAILALQGKEHEEIEELNRRAKAAKRKKSGLNTPRRKREYSRISGHDLDTGTKREDRRHKMKPDDSRLKPRRMATKEEVRELRRSNRKLPLMGGKNFRGQ